MGGELVNDAAMIRLAAERGLVRVDGPKPFSARLVAWKPHRNGRRTPKARIQFPSGAQYTVPCSLVKPLEPPTLQGATK